jgi:hypothetical protein
MHSEKYRMVQTAVFRIRDILVRIRIRGSVPLTNDLDPALSTVTLLITF